MLNSIIISLIFLFIPIFYSSEKIEECGGYERWSVKTLQDEDISSINFKSINTKISEIRNKKPSVNITKNTKRLYEEMQVYTLECKLIMYKCEDDGDVHIIMADLVNDNLTMIAEIPNPICDRVQNSIYVNKFSSSRINFFKYVKNNRIESGIYRVSGVLFFDKKHSINPIGNAPYNAEIHPVLSIKKIR